MSYYKVLDTERTMIQYSIYSNDEYITSEYEYDDALACIENLKEDYPDETFVIRRSLVDDE